MSKLRGFVCERILNPCRFLAGSISPGPGWFEPPPDILREAIGRRRIRDRQENRLSSALSVLTGYFPYRRLNQVRVVGRSFSETANEPFALIGVHSWFAIC